MLLHTIFSQASQCTYHCTEILYIHLTLVLRWTWSAAKSKMWMSRTRSEYKLRFDVYLFYIIEHIRRSGVYGKFRGPCRGNGTAKCGMWRNSQIIETQVRVCVCIDFICVKSVLRVFDIFFPSQLHWLKLAIGRRRVAFVTLLRWIFVTPTYVIVVARLFVNNVRNKFIFIWTNMWAFFFVRVLFANCIKYVLNILCTVLGVCVTSLNIPKPWKLCHQVVHLSEFPMFFCRAIILSLVPSHLHIFRFWTLYNFNCI